jgi:Cytochrome bd terminal oxidase subunit II
LVLNAVVQGVNPNPFLFGAALLPNLVTSSEGAACSLTVFRAASSDTTLEIMRVFAALGMPFVLAYTATIYWVFRGKVKSPRRVTESPEGGFMPTALVDLTSHPPPHRSARQTHRRAVLKPR